MRRNQILNHLNMTLNKECPNKEYKYLRLSSGKIYGFEYSTNLKIRQFVSGHTQNLATHPFYCENSNFHLLVKSFIFYLPIDREDRFKHVDRVLLSYYDAKEAENSITRNNEAFFRRCDSFENATKLNNGLYRCPNGAYNPHLSGYTYFVSGDNKVVDSSEFSYRCHGAGIGHLNCSVF